MGIRDRDYMRRRPEDDDDQKSSPNDEFNSAGWLQRFFKTHPRLAILLLIILAILILIGGSIMQHYV
jgi:hypothetical protein